MLQIIPKEFHDAQYAIQDFVGDKAIVGDDGLRGLKRRGLSVHIEAPAAWAIAHGWRKLHDLIQPRPQLACGHGSVFAGGLDGRDYYIPFGMKHVSLTVGDVLSRQRLKLRAGQFAVASRGNIGDVALVFLRVALVQLQPNHDGLVGRGQLRCFVRFHRCVQGDFLKDIAHGFAMLPDDVFSFAQRL